MLAVTRGRRVWLWVGQGVLALLVIVFLWRALEGRWAEFRALKLEVRPDAAALGLSAFAVWATYALLIAAWRGVLVGWRQPLRYAPAARIWCLANLARYLPGKVWSVAGLAVLAQRAGVAGWAAVASAIAMQALAVGTGAVVVALAAPAAATALQIAIAALLGILTFGVLVWEPGARVVRAVFPAAATSALPFGAGLAALTATLLSWVGYGVAFWLLARGLIVTELPLGQATGIFAAGYIVGLLAVVAPGGVGVREAILIALLVPVLGGGDAVILAVGSRLLLTVTEAGAAFGALLLDRGRSTGEA